MNGDWIFPNYYEGSSQHFGSEQPYARHPIIHFPTSSGMSELASIQMKTAERASKLMSGASVLTSGLLVILEFGP